VIETPDGPVQWPAQRQGLAPFPASDRP